MECLAVIPARGGSKGIPRKNLQKVGGIPLIVHAVRAALGAESITRTVVSTEDKEIATVAKEAGAEVVIRPEELADDVIMPEFAILHVLETLAAEEGYHPDLTCFMQCTSPLTTSYDLDRGIEKLLAQEAHSLLAVAATHDFLWRETNDGTAEAVNHDTSVIRKGRQELEPRYREVGAFHVMQTDGLLAARNRFFGRMVLFEVPPERSVDIDEPFDLELAEFLYNRR